MSRARHASGSVSVARSVANQEFHRTGELINEAAHRITRALLDVGHRVLRADPLLVQLLFLV